MKRFLVLILILALCLAGCGKKKQPIDIPGGSAPPEGVEWKNWEQYTPHTMTMGEEKLDVLIALDAIHLAVYYDREEQELLGSLTILTPLSDVDYSRQRLRIVDLNGDGYDDISVPDLLTNGDRIIDSWLWEPTEKTYLYAPEYSQVQTDISADISWREGKHLVEGVRDAPEGNQDLLFWVDGQTINIYLDTREEQLLTQVQIPQPLSEAARTELNGRSFWDLRDMNADGWGDLQLPYRWEETENGVCAYAYCWLWQESTGTYKLDQERSNTPIV